MRRPAAIAVLALVAALLLLPMASAEVDLGVSYKINTEEPLKGSNITVNVTVEDVGGLVGNETANGTLVVTAGTLELGRTSVNFTNTTGLLHEGFHWVPTDTGTVTLRASLEGVAGDVDASNDVAERSYEVGEPSGVEAGEMSSTATIVGILALVLFFGVIIASVLGWIPQDRLPVQPALILTTFVIMAIAFIGGTYDDHVESFGLSALASKIIIHPITALISGFLVAGALEAAGAFEAAADGLQRLEGFKFKGHALFGIVGTVVLLTNLPTIIAMPCGRILAAALMPAALFFGLRVAKAFKAPAMVSVVVFSFIVNAAASCGPSLIGGIGTIGEGLAGLESGSLSDAQQVGILLATGVCALVMRFVTVSIPPDLAEEEEERLEEERRKAEAAGGMPP